MLSACTKLESDKAVDLWFGISVPLDQCYQYPSHWDTVLLDLHSACPATDDLEFRNLSPVAFHRRRQRVHHPHDPGAGTPAAPCIIGARVAAVTVSASGSLGCVTVEWRQLESSRRLQVEMGKAAAVLAVNGKRYEAAGVDPSTTLLEFQARLRRR